MYLITMSTVTPSNPYSSSFPVPQINSETGTVEGSSVYYTQLTILLLCYILRATKITTLTMPMYTILQIRRELEFLRVQRVSRTA